MKVAFVGAGGMTREHIKAFRDCPGVTLAGIHSRTQSKAKTLAEEYGMGWYDSIPELYRETSAELVVVSVPELAARSVAEACFAHPWAVLLEKPAGYNLAEAEAILTAGRGHKAFVGLNRRQMGSTRAALADVNARSEPRFVYVQDQQSLIQAQQIGHSQAVVDHWMYANSIHLVDYLVAFCRGDASKVQMINPYDPSGGIVLASVEFTSGDRGIYQGIWDRGPGPWAVTVQTSSRRWELRPLELAQFQNAGERKLNPVDALAWDQNFKPGFRQQAEEVLKALRGEPSTAVSLEQSMTTMRLISSIFGR